MAPTPIYYDTNATGAANGTSWADAYPVFADAAINYTGTQRILMASDSSETNPSLTAAAYIGGGIYKYCPVIRVDKTTGLEDPTPLDGTGVANFTFPSSTVVVNDGFRFKGVRIDAQSMALTAHHDYTFEDCHITLSNGSSFAYLDTAGANNLTMLGGKLDFVSTRGSYIQLYGDSSGSQSGLRFVSLAGVEIADAETSPSTPKTLFLFSGASHPEKCQVSVEACDLTGMAAAPTYGLVSSTLAGYDYSNVVTFSSCLFPDGMSTLTPTLPAGAVTVSALGCVDVSGNVYDSTSSLYGESTPDYTSYLDSPEVYEAGASSASWVLTPSSSLNFNRFIRSVPMGGLFLESGTYILTYELNEDFTVALTKEDCYLEVLNSSTGNLERVTSDALNVVTPAALDASTATWINAPAGSRDVLVSVDVTIVSSGYYSGVLNLRKYEAGKSVRLNPKPNGIGTAFTRMGKGELVALPTVSPPTVEATEVIVTSIRGSLSDNNAANPRYSEARIVFLLSRGQEDFVLRTNILKSKITVTINPNLDVQPLPTDTRNISRAVYKNEPADLISHSHADDFYGVDWESHTGPEVKALVYDQMNPTEIKTYPMLVANDGEVLSAEDLALTFYTTIKPAPLTLSGSAGSYVYSALQIPDVYRMILEFYVLGMALRDDQDTQNRALAQEHLAMYANLVEEVIPDTSKDNITSVRTSKNIPVNYNRVI